MQRFVCSCKWTFLIGKRMVYGPIFDDGDASNARMITREEFDEGYGDCAYRFEIRKGKC